MLIRIFDEVFLTYAEISTGNLGNFSLPKSYVTIIDYGLSGAGHATLEDKVLYRAKTFNEFMSKFTSHQQMFDVLKKELTSKKTETVIIYTDPTAMLQFLFSWWKTVFPALTFDGARALWVSYKNAEVLQQTRNWTWIDITSHSENIPFSMIKFRYWTHSDATLREAFSAASPFVGLSKETIYSCPIEFLLMGHSADKLSDMGKAILMERLEKWIFKSAKLEFSKLRQYLEQNLTAIWTEWPALKPYSVLGKDVAEGLSQIPELAWMLDFRIADSDDGFKYIFSAFAVQAFFKNILELDYRMHKFLGIAMDGVLVDNPLTYFISKKGRLPTATEILDKVSEEHTFPGNIDMFKIFLEDVRQRSVNPHLIASFRLLLSENPQEAQQFYLQE